jgi:hypothetical protein
VSYPSLLRLRKLPLRLRIFAVCSALGSAAALARGAPAPDDVLGVAAKLGAAARGVVAPPDVRWEQSGGVVSDVALGRWAVFLASDAPGGPRDVWRARIRVAPEGTPLSVVEAYNLTSTPLGDDHALVVRGERAAFATFAYGQEQSVSLLDLAGDGGDAARGAEEPVADRVMRWLTNVQQTGSGPGVGRVDVTLDQPAAGVGLSLGEDALALDLADPAGVRHASIDYAKGELTVAAPGLHAEAARHLPKRPIFWAVDTVRAVPWIGPGPVAWLEERVFAARDAVKQFAFRLHGATPTDTLASHGDAQPDAARAAARLDASGANVESGTWPPADIPSMWTTAQPGEGIWKEPHLPWLRKLGALDASAPPAFLRTFVRPDEDRPYAEVLLVAMDMRQLDLDMEAGTEDPKPLTGGHGPGRIPRDPQVLTRVVAAWNGAFKTEHGTYGMMVHRRVLLPPQANAATVVVLSDTRVGFGTWANTTDVGGIQGVDDADIVSFRQNLDPLVDKGQLNPMGRALWGYTLPGSGMQTERSGLCVTGAGNLVYAWGDDVSDTTLGKALKNAGCV